MTVVPFSLCGRPARLLKGDVSLGTRGVACARIRYGEGEEDIVEVFNTNVLKHRNPAPQEPLN